jgi:hypothetical protein
MKHYYLLVTAFLISFFPYNAEIFCQSPKLETIDYSVMVGGNPLVKAWQGGLNAPQFNEADLDNDGVIDVVVFDRGGDILLTYLRKWVDGKWELILDREYASYFPAYKDWALMRDYNKDGIQDLFTFSTRGKPGFKVFTGLYQNDTLSFKPYEIWNDPDNIFSFQLQNGSKTQIYIAFDDIPSFDDLDGDGDLDILTFDIGGGYMNYYKNTSIEMGYGLDSLIFQITDQCWGKFYESGISETIDLSTDPGECATALWGGDDELIAGLRHAGSTSLTMDMNNNGLKDLFLGDISFSNITLLLNGGTPQNALITEQVVLWPEQDKPVDIFLFPALYAIDIDNDGVKDLLSAPNNEIGVLDTGNVWYYRNEGSAAFPDFKFQQNDFLVGEMLDVGTGSAPAFLDVDGDGLLDMLIGNFGYYTPIVNFQPSLNYLRNTGTATQPEFTLIDRDYLGLSAFGANFIFSFVPGVGDLDGDGDMDLMIGNSQGNLLYYENTAGAGNPVTFAGVVSNYQNLSGGAYSKPCLYDINGDGLMDILIGNQSGNIRYFQNQGIPGMPAFNANVDQLPNTRDFGLVDVRRPGFSRGLSAPVIYSTSNGIEMLVGSSSGHIIRYEVDATDIYKAFPVVDDLYTGYRDGYDVTPAIADIDKDGFWEVIVGNERGGLTGYRTGEEVVSIIRVPGFTSQSFNAYYLEGSQTIKVVLDAAISNGLINLTLYNALGQTVQSGILTSDQESFVLGQPLIPGIYYLHGKGAQLNQTVKIWVR